MIGNYVGCGNKFFGVCYCFVFFNFDVIKYWEICVIICFNCMIKECVFKFGYIKLCKFDFLNKDLKWWVVKNISLF